ncbi:MAG: hypothetical protein IT428_24475 [Planctomycetaceae bacterium]|nr:hypothetical protein [Planctomycetaceae bacterium]
MAAPTNPKRHFEEYATLEYLLLGDLRAAVEETEDETSHRWLLAVVDALLEALPRKSEATRIAAAIEIPPERLRRKGSKGPRNEKPEAMGGQSASNPAELEPLCREQAELLKILQDLRGQIADAPLFLSQRSAYLPQMIAWMDRIGEHNQRTAAVLKPHLEADQELK